MLQQLLDDNSSESPTSEENSEGSTEESSEEVSDESPEESPEEGTEELSEQATAAGPVMNVSLEGIYEAEVTSHHSSLSMMKGIRPDMIEILGTAAQKDMVNLVNWAKKIPQFTELPVGDQAILLSESRPYFFLTQYTN